MNPGKSEGGDETQATPMELGQSYAALVGEDGWENDAMGLANIPTTPPTPRRIIEALLFVGGEPLAAERACGIVRGLTVEQFDDTICQLNEDYRRQGRPYWIQPCDPGWMLTLRPRFRHVIPGVYGGVREARLSTAAIDVLALVAYRQPLTKGEADSMRGADSGALLRQLVRRGLIHVVRRADTPQSEAVFATTHRFLSMFGLQSLDDLPKTHDLQQL